MTSGGRISLSHLSFFVIGLVAAFLIFKTPQWFRQLAIQKEGLSREIHCDFKYINPLRCEPDLAKKKKEYVTLRNDLMEYIEKEKQDNKVTDTAVYFRDLQNGPVLSINSQNFFIPASLLKLPLLITYYKKAEGDPGLLKKKLVVQGDLESLPQNITPGKTAQVGKEYSRDELLSLLITQSDNTSWKMLLSDLRDSYSEEDFVSTLSDLGIIDPRKRSDQQYITVQSYASIFRILYNSSYLNLEMSERALTLLTQTEFKNGLVAGVPAEIKVAHKFGEQRNGEEQQLHDCGIIYFTPNPYLICIMTKGYETADLSDVIREISEKVYDEIESRQEE